MDTVRVKFIRRVETTGEFEELLDTPQFPVPHLPRTGEWINLTVNASFSTHSQVLKFTTFTKLSTWGNLLIDYIEIELA